MRFLSSTDIAIATAAKRGTLRIIERPSRLGGTFVAITDEHGTIEVADTKAAAEQRIQQVAH